jgi:hypothetical protein
MLLTHLKAIWYIGFRVALLCLAPICTSGVVGGVVILPSMSQLVNIIVTIEAHRKEHISKH